MANNIDTVRIKKHGNNGNTLMAISNDATVQNINPHGIAIVKKDFKYCFAFIFFLPFVI